MGRDTEVARERARYRLAEHREAGRPRTPDAFCQALQRTGSAGLVNRAEDIEKIGKRVQDAARVKVPEAEHASVGAAGVIGEDRLERRMALFGGAPLLARIA